MQRVLVLGSGGFIGREIVRKISSTSDVIAAQRSLPASGSVHPPSPNIQLVAVDLADPDAIQSLIGGLRPSAVVNCAASVDFTPQATASPLWPVNSLLPSVVAEACLRIDAHLIHLSGSIVHGDRAAFAGTSIRPAPDSAYGVTKLLADEMIAGSGAAASILRLPGIFGLDGPSHLGLNRALSSAQSGQPVQLHGSGAERRNYLSVLQVAETVRFCLQTGPLGVAYVGGATHTIANYLENISSHFGVPIDRRAGDSGSDAIVEVDRRIPRPKPFPEALRELTSQS
jgi:nucleoside-diphosphate-sugar epimerase